MKAVELMNRLFEWCNDNGEKDYSKTCDTLKCGDPEKEIRKVAVAMAASVDLIREAHRWGADLLIVHEPTFYNHFDEHLEDDPVTTAKEALLKESGITPNHSPAAAPQHLSWIRWAIRRQAAPAPRFVCFKRG